VTHNRLLARSLRGLFAFAITEQGCWLAILLYAYTRGGVSEAGWVSVLMLVPTALLAPVVALAIDAFPRHRVLTIGYAMVAATSIATGVAMLADAGPVITYGSAVSFSILLTFAGPATAVILPTAATTADELTAANTAASVIDTTGRLVGPLVAGAILTFSSPGAVLVWIGGLMAVGAASTMGRGVTATQFSGRHADDPARGSGLIELTAGLRLLRHDPQVRTLTGAVSSTSWISGAIDVGAVAVVIDVLRRDDAAVGLLLIGFGAGGLLGSAAGFALVGRQHLARALGASVVLMSVFFAVLGRSPNVLAATLLLTLVGAGATLTSLAGRTMLQGLTPDDTLARLFGVLEALESVAMALGGVALSILAVRTSVATSCSIVGGMALLGLVVMWPRLRSIDRARRPIEPSLLRLARSSTVFGPLPPFAIEQVMSGIVTETFAPGESIIVKGDVGDRMCLLGAGGVEVATESGAVIRHEPGVVLGEIAVLRNVPRTADVVAGDVGATVHWIDADAFLDAVNRVPRSRARVEAEVERRLEQ
jgi:MFS family permease